MKKTNIEALQKLYSLLSTEAFLERKKGDTLQPETIKEIRSASGLTQEQFAEKLGLSGGKSTISSWETGNTRCTGISAEAVILTLKDMVREWDSAPMINGAKSATVSVSNLEMMAMIHKSPFEVAASRLSNVDIIFMKRLPSARDCIDFQVVYRASK